MANPPHMPIELQQWLAQAMTLHQAGRLNDAAPIYERILGRSPALFEAQYMLGLLRSDQGRFPEALDLIGGALKTRPDSLEALYLYGLTLLKAGRLDEALASFDRLLVSCPDAAEILSARAIVLHALGRYQEALTALDKSVAIRPDYSEAWYNRAISLEKLDRRDEALSSYDRVLAIVPGDVKTLTNRGALLSSLKRFPEALASLDKALALKPDHVEALNNRANALHELGRDAEALPIYAKALQIRPEYPQAYNNQGLALEALDRSEEALAAFDKALAIWPGYTDALVNRGNCLMSLNRGDEAIECFRKALALEPRHPKARYAICAAELLVIYADDEEVKNRRARYEKHLRELCDEFERGDASHLIDGFGSYPPFYLAYQGRDDRALQSLYGSLGCRMLAQRYGSAAMPLPPAPGEPVRVGVVSGFFWRHSVWKIPTQGWLTQLDRRKFQVFGYHTDSRTDSTTQAAANLCDRFVQGPMTVERWRQTILADAPHVLLYPDIGMHVDTAVLAAQRLAPVQCISLGHPDTSGFPTLDYFLSSDLMEPENGDDHYTERLVRLPNISVYYEPLEQTAVPVRREDFGLRPDATVYWCGQSLYKFMPSFDDVFARIARDAGNCQFVFIEYAKSRYVTEQFRARMARAFNALGLESADHCVFLPRLDQQRFYAAIGLCDVVLDSIGWSGFNSTMEGLPHDLPIVTMAAPLMRGRHTTAVLRMMGVTETIAQTADEYVSAAVRLAADIEWRTLVGRRMAASRHRAYRDSACISALEEFMDRAVRGKAR